MRMIGLDLGSKTLGIATSDPSGLIASGYQTLRFNEHDYRDALKQLTPLVKDLQPSKIVLGLPKNMNGSIGFQAETALKFQKMMEDAFAIDVVLVDERLTSRMAESVMISADLSRKKRKKKVDSLAATLILQSYLDSRK